MARGLAFKHKKYTSLKKEYANYEQSQGRNIGAVVATPCPCSCYKCGKHSGHAHQYYKAKSI